MQNEKCKATTLNSKESDCFFFCVIVFRFAFYALRLIVAATGAMPPVAAHTVAAGLAPNQHLVAAMRTVDKIRFYKAPTRRAHRRIFLQFHRIGQKLLIHAVSYGFARPQEEVNNKPGQPPQKRQQYYQTPRPRPFETPLTVMEGVKHYAHPRGD